MAQDSKGKTLGLDDYVSFTRVTKQNKPVLVNGEHVSLPDKNTPGHFLPQFEEEEVQEFFVGQVSNLETFDERGALAVNQIEVHYMGHNKGSVQAVVAPASTFSLVVKADGSQP